MLIARHKILSLVVSLQLCLLGGSAGAQDASIGSLWPEQIARSVEGGVVTAAPNADNYLIQNDLLTGPSLSMHPPQELDGGWLTSRQTPDIADPNSDIEAVSEVDETDRYVDPSAPPGIHLSEGVRGRFKAKNGAAVLGLAIELPAISQ